MKLKLLFLKTLWSTRLMKEMWVKKKGPGNFFFFQKLFFWTPLTLKIAFPKSDLILLGRNGHFKFIG